MTRTEHYRACHLCEAICGLAIETVTEPDSAPRITSIKGDPLDTFSRGHICPKAVALQDIQNDPTACVSRCCAVVMNGGRLPGRPRSIWWQSGFTPFNSAMGRTR